MAELLPERTTPELRYLETKWASLMSYGMTVDLLKEVLPVSDDLSTRAIRADVERAAQRLDRELGDERNTFIEGTPADWSEVQVGDDYDDDDETLIAAELIPDLTSLKWNLWHGNVRRALEIVDDLDCNVDSLSTRADNANKLARMLREFRGYIHANQAFIPNYGDRWRNGEAISTAVVESAVNQIVSRRFVKKQQMRWTEHGSHHLLQIRTRVLNDEWRPTMARWNPGMGVAA